MSSAEWADAVRAASAILPFAAQDDVDAGGMVATALSEALFGPDRWSLSYAKRLYYQSQAAPPAVSRPSSCATAIGGGKRLIFPSVGQLKIASCAFNSPA